MFCKWNKDTALDERLLKPEKEPDEKFKWAVLTSPSIQHKKIKNIIRKHWEVLRQDNILCTLVPEEAKVIFRGAPTLQGRVTPNVINPPAHPSFFHDLTVFFPCRKCVVCQHNTLERRKVTEFTSTVTGRRYTIKSFCTCSTGYIVYLITCPCHKQYIGHTIRTFSISVCVWNMCMTSWRTLVQYLETWNARQLSRSIAKLFGTHPRANAVT